MLTSAAVKSRAAELGFDLCGVAPAAGFPRLEVLREWLDRGYAGEMGYMERTADRRADVRAVLPTARSVIVLGTLYNTDRSYSTEVDDPGTALISRYAWGDDYHDVLGARTEALRSWMLATHPESFESRAYVDTGPVQEKAWAERAGLGWVGKNACVINPELGSWLFLSVVICSVSLDPDPPALDQCGTCTLCLDACPTEAFPAPGILDATRCLSYLTIELKGPLPEDLRASLGAHVYGCDVCQEVCPYNDRAPLSSDPAWQPRLPLDRPLLTELWTRSDSDLRDAIRRGPMTRARVKRLRRNLAVALGNAGAAGAAAALAESAADDPDTRASRAEPVVDEHVTWARRRLSGGDVGPPPPRSGRLVDPAL